MCFPFKTGLEQPRVALVLQSSTCSVPQIPYRSLRAACRATSKLQRNIYPTWTRESGGFYSVNIKCKSFIGYELQRRGKQGEMANLHVQSRLSGRHHHGQAPCPINPSGRISKGLRGFKFPLCFQNPCRLVLCQHGWPIAHCPCRITWRTFGSLSNAHGPTG